MENNYKKRYEKLISKLKQAREEAGLKQEFVAEKLGKYSSYLSKIEHGDRKVDALELIDLAKMYKKDISFFVEGKDSKKKK